MTQLKQHWQTKAERFAYLFAKQGYGDPLTVC